MSYRAHDDPASSEVSASSSLRAEQPVYVLRLDDSAIAQQVDLMQVLQFLRRNLVLIAALTLAGILVGFAWAKVATRYYRAQLVMSVLPDTEDAGLAGSLPAGVAGLASLAGVQLGGNGKAGDEALALLRSRSFIERFIEDEQLLPVLFSKRWDPVEKTWIGAPKKRAPTLQDGFERFSRGVMRITENRKTGLATLQIQWRDRALAALWANRLVARADRALRERAIKQADSAMEFLNSELQNTTVVEMRQALNSLIVRQTQKRMLAKTRPEFAFRVVDAALPSDAHRFVRPKMLVSLAVGMALGLMLGVGIAVLRSQARLRRQAG